MTRFDVIWLTRWIAAHLTAIAGVIGVGVRLERRALRRQRRQTARAAWRERIRQIDERVATALRQIDGPVVSRPVRVPLALPRAWSGWPTIGARRQPPPPPRLLIHTCPPVARWQPWVSEAGAHRPPVDWAHRQLDRILAAAAQPALFEVTR